MNNQIMLQSAKQIGAGLATIGLAGVGAGIGIVDGVGIGVGTSSTSQHLAVSGVI